MLFKLITDVGMITISLSDEVKRKLGGYAKSKFIESLRNYFSQLEMKKLSLGLTKKLIAEVKSLDDLARTLRGKAKNVEIVSTR